MSPSYNGVSDRKQSSVAHANALDAARLRVTSREGCRKAPERDVKPEWPKGPGGNTGIPMGVRAWRRWSAARGFCLSLN